MSDSKGWIGIDLDRTLAHYDRWRGELHIGDPIPLMVSVVRELMAEGYEIRIFTARVACEDPLRSQIVSRIQDWLETEAGLPRFAVTNVKDWDMIALYDDRAVGVRPNTGEIIR